MKNGIIYLGIALGSMVVNSYASNEKQIDITKRKNVTLNIMLNGNGVNCVNDLIKNPNYDDLMYPEKTIEEKIKMDNEITENTIDFTFRPIYLERTKEDLISEDNKIIESDTTNEVYKLDFDYINSKPNKLNIMTNNKFVG